jgi:hypothetical protein
VGRARARPFRRGHQRRFLILYRAMARLARIVIVNVPHCETLTHTRARRKMGNVPSVPICRGRRISFLRLGRVSVVRKFPATPSRGLDFTRPPSVCARKQHVCYLPRTIFSRRGKSCASKHLVSGMPHARNRRKGLG